MSFDIEKEDEDSELEEDEEDYDEQVLEVTCPHCRQLLHVIIGPAEEYEEDEEDEEERP